MWRGTWDERETIKSATDRHTSPFDLFSTLDLIHLGSAEILYPSNLAQLMRPQEEIQEFPSQIKGIGPKSRYWAPTKDSNKQCLYGTYV